MIKLDGKWIKNNGSNFYIEFGGKKQIQKVTLSEIVLEIPLNQLILVYVTLSFKSPRILFFFFH